MLHTGTVVSDTVRSYERMNKSKLYYRNFPSFSSLMYYCKVVLIEGCVFLLIKAVI